ncbi:MAG: hypothetical protein IID61_17790 [SAR324 cluster bacterium]|nr:hypothetical protein [SAR324 cluster bacterium]
MARSGPIDAGSGRSTADGEDRFDAMLEERFSGDRGQMARQLAEHDRAQVPAAFDRDHVRRKIRFRGQVPEPLQKALREAIPALLAWAAERGLRLRDLNHEVHILAKAAYEAERGSPVPKGLSLPAASFQLNQLYRIYTVRVVLSGRAVTTGEAVAVLRVVMSRMLGDIFLREEVLSGGAYREEMAARGGDVSAGLEEKIALAEALDTTPPGLEQALKAHASRIAMNYKRFPDKVRKAYFQEMAQHLAQQTLDPDREALVDAVFQEAVAGYKSDPEGAVASAIAAVEDLNRQMNFLPPDEAPHHRALRENNPVHFLRSAKLRLEYVIEVLSSLAEDFDDLEPGSAAASPLIEEHLDGHMTELREQNLVRLYLIPNVKLSDELEKKRSAFPFEVHALLQRMPPADNPEKAFRTWHKRISQSLHQRLYAVLLDFKSWVRNRELGRDSAFRGGERYKSLKGQIANFKFRLPFLRALNARVGIVLDSLESGSGGSAAEEEKTRFPIEQFTQAWNYFVAARVIVEALPGAEGVLPKFDSGRYRTALDDTVSRAIAKGPGIHHLVWMLNRLCDLCGAEGLPVLTDLIKHPSGTFRFAVGQALAQPPEGASAQARLEQLEQWASLVLQARKRTMENTNVPSP